MRVKHTNEDFWEQVHHSLKKYMPGTNTFSNRKIKGWEERKEWRP